MGVEPQDGQGLEARTNPVVNRERGESQGGKGKHWGAKGGKARFSHSQDLKIQCQDTYTGSDFNFPQSYSISLSTGGKLWTATH